jgi:hypothetical protein
LYADFKHLGDKNLSSINKTDRHEIAKTLLKVELKTITLTPIYQKNNDSLELRWYHTLQVKFDLLI